MKNKKSASFQMETVVDTEGACVSGGWGQERLYWCWFPNGNCRMTNDINMLWEQILVGRAIARAFELGK